ncbi:RecQ family ATP-dependent DNA helicase [Fluviispira multicolorata]|uniref:RecQ family ATP-dependent DNA helicase n=1 Tax=Fluviispira multicolorata TaxID=2654512 RepID=A0A833JE58_9BACT|nr:RecQ family ATP-dependent DNA helicase [Fluviispira multicolorata]KAB8032225.1 RecQ family ATP-dependent DNA helicase [Fluviispira multicolorata]
MQTDFIQKCEEFAKNNFSLSELRPAQREVLAQIYEKRFVIATLPTGAGKTLLYTLPALFFENEPVLVISPLISLMRDQERRMSEASIPCVIFTSEQSEEERKESWNKLKSGEAKIIFASPERFVLPSFINAISKINLGMAVVDEAHCVVAWGHNFRPEYSEIGKILTKLQPPRILAITATAGRNSRQDIIKRVFPENIQVTEYISKPLAENIFVESHRVFSIEEQWNKLVEILKDSNSQKILVYFQSRILCEDSVRKLRKLKIHSVAYHAGLPKLERKSVEQYAHDTTQKTVICATTAFGMGIDVSGIRLVVVYGFPSNIEEFFQMLGRGGRSGEPSKGLLLWTGSDPIKREFQFKSSFPEPSLFLELSALFIRFMPTHFGESCFVNKNDLLEVIKTKKEQDKLKKLENIIAGLRICNALEDTRTGDTYYIIKVAAHLTFIDILAGLPEGITKRKKILDGLTSLVEKCWLSLRGGQCVVSLKKLMDASEMNVTSCEQVFLHYNEQKIINFAKIDNEQAKQGVILKNGYAHLQKELPRYISARSHFHASLRELDKLSTSTTCRLSASFEFFAPRHIQGASKNIWRCMQCDICIRKRTE